MGVEFGAGGYRPMGVMTGGRRGGWGGSPMNVVADDGRGG